MPSHDRWPENHPEGYPVPTRRVDRVKPKKSHKLLWIILIAIAFVVGSCTIAVIKAGPSAAPVSSPAGGTLPPVAPDPNASSDVQEDAGAPGTTPQIAAVGVFTDGVYEIGKEIPVGRYKTAGNSSGSDCYWAKSKDGSSETLLDNDIGKGQRTVTIKPGGFIEFNGDCDWRKVG